MKPGFPGQPLAEQLGNVSHLVKGNGKPLVDPLLELPCPIAGLTKTGYQLSDLSGGKVSEADRICSQ